MAWVYSRSGLLTSHPEVQHLPTRIWTELDNKSLSSPSTENNKRWDLDLGFLPLIVLGRFTSTDLRFNQISARSSRTNDSVAAEEIDLFSIALQAWTIFHSQLLTRQVLKLWRAHPTGLHSQSVPAPTPSINHPLTLLWQIPIFLFLSPINDCPRHLWTPGPSCPLNLSLINLSFWCSTQGALNSSPPPLPSHINITEHPQASG